MEMLENEQQKRIRKTMTYRYVVFCTIALGYFFVFFHRVSTAVMAKDLAVDFAIDPAAVGLFGSMYFYAYAMAQLPVGVLVDKWGIRNISSLFILLAGFATFLFGMAHSFSVALTARFFVGLGVAFMYVPALRMLADWFRKDEYSTYSGILVGVGNLGALAASAPLALLIVAIQWRNTMVLIGGVTIIIAILLFIFVRNKPEDINGASVEEIEKAPPRIVVKVRTVDAIKVLFSKYNFWTILIFFFIWIGTLFAFQGLWAGPYLTNVFQLSQTQASNILMLIAVGAIVGCPLSGYLSDKVIKSPKKVILVGMSCYIVVWLIFVLFTGTLSLNMIRILMFLFGLFGYSQVVVWANLKENVDIVMLGTASGIVNFFGFTGAAIYQQVLGLIITKVTGETAASTVLGFRISFVFCLISLVAGLAFYITQKEKPRETI